MTWWRRWGIHVGAGVVLALFVGALYYPILFTNRVLASGDILLYFYPYRDFVSSALRNGQIPFWNPYLFAGVPLLANPQAAVLYPLHWPLIWLPVTKQVYWSAALHTWLLGLGGYVLLRRWGYGGWAGLAAGITLAGSGLVGGLMGHLNQLNSAAWLPWTVVCVEWPISQHLPWPKLLRRAGWLGIVVALMLLAGHTQTTYIALFGLGMWVIWPLWGRLWAWAKAWRAARRGERLAPSWTVAAGMLRPVGWRLAVYVGGVALGALLAAPQLLPTLELNTYGLRTGGLDFLEATSFSLKPPQLHWALLPTYGLPWFGSLASIFGTPAYSEFVGYVGLLALVLAVIGAWKGCGPARTFGLLFVVLGLALAIGRYNPLYYVFYQLVPGVALFRVPARWLLLYTVGAGVLAGVGLQWAIGAVQGWAGRRGRAARWLPVGAALVVALMAGELLAAAQALPHTHPTAPEAVDGIRTAPAHLITDPQRSQVDPAASGRFVGLSTITYDPGDMPDYKHIMLESTPPQLDPRAFDDLVIAQKVQELLVPNLALLWRVPSVDGFDGGVLPLKRFNAFAHLLIPPEIFGPDGRLREQLRSVPPAPLLNLMDVQYLITDKVKDLWFENVYYDRQIGLQVDKAQPTKPIGADGDFQATHLDLIAYAEAEPAVWDALRNGATTAVTVTVRGPEGTAVLPVSAGGGKGAMLADGALGSSLAQASGAAVAYQDTQGKRHEYRVRLPLGQSITPTAIEVQLADPRLAVHVTAATLYDDRTKMFTALLPSDRGQFARVHSGDVKIYENLDNPARAYIATSALSAKDPVEALALLQAQGTALAAGPITTVVEGPAVAAPAVAGVGDKAEIVAYAPERVEVRTQAGAPGYLVLADAYYPGWRATVDGAAAPIYPANVLFRGVPIPAGEHTVIFTFHANGWELGLGLSLLGLVLTLAALSAPAWGRVRSRRAAAV